MKITSNRNRSLRLPQGPTSPSSDSSPKPSSSQLKTPSRGTTPSASEKPDLSKILGPDRKLPPEELERRKKNGLCMVFGI